VSVWSKAQVNEIKNRWQTREFAESQCVAGCGVRRKGFHWHSVNLLQPQRGRPDQTVAKVREISIRVSVASYTFIHLNYIKAFPRKFFARQRAQHDPRSVAATEGHDEPTALCNGGTSFCSYDCGAFLRDRFEIGKHFGSHDISDIGSNDFLSPLKDDASSSYAAPTASATAA
jgi:hypothetical protein